MTLIGSRTGRLWVVGAVLATLVVAVPVGVIFSSIFRPSDGVWSHLVETRLSVYASNTAILAIGVCVCAGVLGVSTAWILSTYRFPGSRLLGWAQLLPLAVPAYLSAYALSDLLQFSGPVQGWIRATFGLQGGNTGSLRSVRWGERSSSSRWRCIPTSTSQPGWRSWSSRGRRWKQAGRWAEARWGPSCSWDCPWPGPRSPAA